jgi:hypothetical protein
LVTAFFYITAIAVWKLGLRKYDSTN